MSEETKYYTDPNGEKVPAKYVKPYDRLRDRIALGIARDWEAEHTRLVALNERTLAAIAKLQAASAASVEVKDLGGAKGNIQFRSFDGAVTVRVDNARRTEFDERLKLAQQLIEEAVRELTADAASADLVEIATKAFQPRTSGNLDMQRIRDLRKLHVKHAKWKQACEIIGECERTIGHRRYVRVSVRRAPDVEPESISLDIAAL